MLLSHDSEPFLAQAISGSNEASCGSRLRPNVLKLPISPLRNLHIQSNPLLPSRASGQGPICPTVLANTLGLVMVCYSRGCSCIKKKTTYFITNLCTDIGLFFFNSITTYERGNPCFLLSSHPSLTPQRKPRPIAPCVSLQNFFLFLYLLYLPFFYCQQLLQTFPMGTWLSASGLILCVSVFLKL